MRVKFLSERVSASSSARTQSAVFTIEISESGTYAVTHVYEVVAAPDPSTVTSTAKGDIELSVPGGWVTYIEDIDVNKAKISQFPSGNYRFNMQIDSAVTADVSIDHLFSIRSIK